jgi:hypothetical protein
MIGVREWLAQKSNQGSGQQAEPTGQNAMSYAEVGKPYWMLSAFPKN